MLYGHRPLWVKKLSDDKLKSLLKKVDKMELKNGTNDEELLNISKTWYYHPVVLMNLDQMSRDLWREADYRWGTR